MSVITYHQNPDGTLAHVTDDGWAVVISGDVQEGATLLTQEEYEAAQEQQAIDIAAGVAELVADSAAVKPEHLKLYRYLPLSTLDHSIVPHNVNYITAIDGRLHPTNTIIVDGEIRQVDYYAEATPPNAAGVVTYSDLVVREEFAYTRDAMGFARARTQTITWYREDDAPHDDVKVRVKYYENDESLREGQRRRSNITDTLAMTISGWLVVTQTQHESTQARIQMGRDFMAHHKIAFDMFTDASDAGILTDVQSDADPAHAWLDSYIAAGVTVRAYIIDTLNIWNLVL